MIVPEPETRALLAALASLLLKNGQTTERTVTAIEHAGAALGWRATLYPAWGASILRLEGRDADGGADMVVAVDPAGIDMSKVERAMALVDRLRAGGAAPAAAIAELEVIAALPPVALPRFAIMAGLGAAALAVIFGATHPPSLALIALAAAMGGVLRRALALNVHNLLAQPLAAALFAGLVGAWAPRLGIESPLHLVAVCPCMVLVPGPHLLNGILDLARDRIALGIARLVYASLVVLMICVGLLAGLTLGGAALPVSGASTPVPLAFDVLAAGVAVAAYASFFAMPWRTVPAPVLIGMLAHACRWAVLAADASVESGAFVACLMVGAIVTPLANRNHWPFAAVAFAATVSMIPGVFLFRMTAGLVALIAQGGTAPPALLVAILGDGTTAALILLAMAFGLIVPKMAIERLFPPG